MSMHQKNNMLKLSELSNNALHSTAMDVLKEAQSFVVENSDFDKAYIILAKTSKGPQSKITVEMYNAGFNSLEASGVLSLALTQLAE